MANHINQKAVAKNTLLLFIRMGVAMVVSLYTSRVVLATLGIEDFGIYNVVGSVVVMFSFMNITLSVAIRRFLAFELGRVEAGNVQKVFNASIIAVLIASTIIVIGLETIGLWFLNNKLNIPSERLPVANFVYQLSILTFFLNMNLIPFSSAIVAYEKMGVYAYIGIGETLLRLCLVLSLPFLPGDKLRLYSMMTALLSILVIVCNYIYCCTKVIKPKSISNTLWIDVKPIFKFSAWTIMGSMVYMLATQGVNMLYNIYFGVAINAALGVAQQISNATNQFVGSFQTAFNPQLTKSYSSEGLSKNTYDFVCQTSKLSITLILIIVVPIIANASSILDLWLKDVPSYAVAFTIIFLLYTAIDSMSAPLYFLVYAKGDLKLYQIALSVIQLFYVLIVYLLCGLGYNPIVALSINVVSATLMYFARLIILKKLMNFPVLDFSKRVIFPLIVPLLFLLILCIVNKTIQFDFTLLLTISKIVVFVLFVIIICFYLYLDKQERSFVQTLIKKRN